MPNDWIRINSDVYEHKVTKNKIMWIDNIWVHVNIDTGIQTPIVEMADNPIRPFGFNAADVDYSLIPTDGGDW